MIRVVLMYVFYSRFQQQTSGSELSVRVLKQSSHLAPCACVSLKKQWRRGSQAARRASGTTAAAIIADVRQQMTVASRIGSTGPGKAVTMIAPGTVTAKEASANGQEALGGAEQVHHGSKRRGAGRVGRL